jgi:hypothetical protein
MNAKWSSRWMVRLGLVAACVLTVSLFLLSRGNRTHAQDHMPVHMTTDWSNRHMVYSTPSSMSQARGLRAEPRYLHQLIRRAAPAVELQPVQ